jgi:hypothetical protein
MIAIAVLAADIAGTLDLSDVSEARLRSTPPLGQSTAQPSTPGALPSHGLDLVTRPAVALALHDRTWEYAVSYGATIILPDVETGLTPQLLQTGGLKIGWHGRYLRVVLSEDGAYGIQNSAYLVPAVAPTPGQPAPPQTLAATAPITFGYERTGLVGTLELDPRTQSSAGIEYLFSGGLDSASQTLLPEMWGPRGTFELDHTLTRTDQLVTASYAQIADFTAAACLATSQQSTSSTCKVSDRLGQVTETLRHRLSRSDTASLGAGAAMTSVRLVEGQPYQTSFYPVVEGTYTKAFNEHGGGAALASTFVLFARYAPFLDVRSGIVLPTLLGECRLAEPITRVVAFRLSVGASQGFPVSDPAAAFLVRGELGVDYHVSKRVDISLGERWFWQEAQKSLGSLATAYGLLAVTVRERTLQF